MLCEFRGQCGDQFARLLVDGTLAVEMVVVLGDGEHALARDIASAQHVFEERNDIVVTLQVRQRKPPGLRRSSCSLLKIGL